MSLISSFVIVFSLVTGGRAGTSSYEFSTPETNQEIPPTFSGVFHFPLSPTNSPTVSEETLVPSSAGSQSDFFFMFPTPQLVSSNIITVPTIAPSEQKLKESNFNEAIDESALENNATQSNANSSSIEIFGEVHFSSDVPSPGPKTESNVMPSSSLPPEAHFSESYWSTQARSKIPPTDPVADLQAYILAQDVFNSNHLITPAGAKALSQPPSPDPSHADKTTPEVVVDVTGGLSPEAFWMTRAPSRIPSQSPTSGTKDTPAVSQLDQGLSPEVHFGSDYWMTLAPSKTPSNSPTSDTNNTPAPTAVSELGQGLSPEVHFDSKWMTETPSKAPAPTSRPLSLSPEVHFSSEYWMSTRPSTATSPPVASDAQAEAAPSSGSQNLSPEVHFSSKYWTSPRPSMASLLSPTNHLQAESIAASTIGQTAHSTFDIPAPKNDDTAEMFVAATDPTSDSFETPAVPTDDESSVMPSIMPTAEATAEHTPEFTAESSSSPTFETHQGSSQTPSAKPLPRPHAISPSNAIMPTISPILVVPTSTEVPTKKPSNPSALDLGATSSSSFLLIDDMTGVPSAMPSIPSVPMVMTDSPSSMPSIPTLMYLEGVLLPKREKNDGDSASPAVDATKTSRSKRVREKHTVNSILCKATNGVYCLP